MRITIEADGAAKHPLAALVRASFEQACADPLTLPPAALAMTGMSGRRYRQFINNLVRATPDPRYLEVGSWAGSTLCSAIVGNKVTAMAIDNWSQFAGPVAAFLHNLSRFINPDARVSFLTQDFRAVPFAAIGQLVGQYNIYLFDGPHTAQDQYDGVCMALPALEADFVLIADDWNWKSVRDGVSRAIAECGLHCALSIEVRTTLDNSHPAVHGPESDWHNGYFIAAATQPRASLV